MTTIYLIRHAEAEGNLYRLAHGQYNSLVTPRGYRQLACLRRRFRDVPIDAVYGSDLFRTQATASAVYGLKNLPFRPLPLLREVNLGAWEGLTWTEVQRLDQEMLVHFNREPDLFRVDGGETFDVVRDRLLEGIHQIARECPDATVAATSHGAAMRVLLGTIQGLSLRETGTLGHCDNTAVNCLEVENGRIRLVYQNDTTHLTEGLSTFRRQTWHKNSLATEPGLWFRTLREDEAGKTLEGMMEEDAAGRVEMVLADDALVINDYRLLPQYRGHRFGGALMGQAVQYARKNGREKLRLTCSGDLAGYFAQFGFQETERRGTDRVMELDIRMIIREIPEA